VEPATANLTFCGCEDGAGLVGDQFQAQMPSGDLKKNGGHNDARGSRRGRIDEAFGAGYAKGHPELVAALVQAAAFDRVAKAITSNPVPGDLARKFLLAELTELTEELEELPPPRKLGENDRLATGYLPRLEFEAAVDEFFARPQTSVRGWEPAA